MRFARSPRFAFLALTLVLASPALACGDDEGTDTGADTTPLPGTSEGSTSTGDASTSTGADASTSSTTASVDGTSSTTAAESSEGDSTTGSDEDAASPQPDGGACPDGFLPVSLPGAEICAPFCGGPDDACPVAATGDAAPQCTPFAGKGGSGDPCDDATTCPNGETCNDGACTAIAFHACQLFCAMGETCPDAMECSGIGTCGYP